MPSRGRSRFQAVRTGMEGTEKKRSFTVEALVCADLQLHSLIEHFRQSLQYSPDGTYTFYKPYL